MSEPVDPEAVALAGRVFDLARCGHADELAAHVDAGVPADPGRVDPDAGEWSARATAAFFGLPDMAELLDATA